MQYESLAALIASNLNRASETLLLCDETISFNKHELKAAIAMLHFEFNELNFKSNDRVAVVLPRSALTIVIIYAIVTYGCVYVPIDSKWPRERQEFISNDVNPIFIINESNTFSSCEKIRNKQFNFNLEPQFHFNEKNALAAILYTSGSTGFPKGIALSHQAILFFVEWAFNRFAITTHDKIANLAPFHFDLSLFDLFVIWYCDCQLFVIPHMLTSFPIQLTQFLAKNAISIWYTVPSMLHFLSQKGGLKTISLPELRIILFAGEVFPTLHLTHLLSLLPTTQFFNLYGPTETNVCTYWPVPRKKVLPSSIPIGIPVEGSTVKINPDTHTLMVKSESLFSGYWQAGQIQKSQRDGWYDTGDVVSLDHDNVFYYHGRLDRMVKIAGHRIELGEVEAVMQTYPGIVEGVALTVSKPENQIFLVACYIEQCDFDMDAFKIHLNQSLPLYMQPHLYLSLKEIPRLANGKRDLLTLKNKIEEHYATLYSKPNTDSAIT